MSDLNREPWNPELLAGYADAELSAADKAKVEARLVAHPGDRSELDAQSLLSKRNTKFWKPLAVPVPDERKWATVMANVHAGLACPAPAAKPAAASSPWYRWATPAVAAAVLAAVFVLPAYRPTVTNVVSEEGLPVCKAADVEIISIHEADIGMLCVGDAPQRAPLELATTADVTYHKVVGDIPTNTPTVEPIAGSNKPMFRPGDQPTVPTP